MLRSILSSFAHSYGRTLGRTAARRTAWLAIPVLIIVAIMALMGIDASNLHHLVAPGIPGVLHALGL